MSSNDFEATLKTGPDPSAQAWVDVPRLKLKPEGGRPLTIDLDGPLAVLIGRDPACDLVIKAPSVSGRHAKLERRDDGLWLTDLGSTNGSFVNDVAVERARVTPGDTIRLGDVTVSLQTEDEPTLILPDKAQALGPMVGASEQMRLLFGVIKRVARTDLTVLIQGETGTGKELVARTLHDLSARAKGPFVVVDSTTLSGDLANSELFGHEKGSFTGADAQRPGAFERADGGTVFIDEVGELSADVQSRLLRVLETHTFTRVGGNTPLRSDVRVVAATHRDVLAMVAAGEFRQDLVYRLNEVGLLLPPLRARREDVPLLVARLVDQLRTRLGPDAGSCTFSEAALAAIAEYDWPGNVRELRNYLARVLAMAAGTQVDVGDLLPMGTSGGLAAVGVPTPRSAATSAATNPETLRDMEVRMIRDALSRADGNRAKAARELGIPVSTLKDRLKRYDL